mgnify:FL=1
MIPDTLIESTRRAQLATDALTDAVVAPCDCKPGEFYVAVGAAEWNGPVPFILSPEGAEPTRLNIWGFSVWRNEPGYRTLGVDFAVWVGLPGQRNVIIRRDYDRVAAHKRST